MTNNISKQFSYLVHKYLHWSSNDGYEGYESGDAERYALDSLQGDDSGQLEDFSAEVLGNLEQGLEYDPYGNAWVIPISQETKKAA